MANLEKLVQQYYKGFQEGKFSKELFTEDFQFIGPMMHCDGRTEFFGMLKLMEEMVDIKSLDFHGYFIDDAKNQVCAVFDFVTSKPLNGSTRYAEIFTFDNDKIKSINLIYDAREWGKAMGVYLHQLFK